jgi:hypothetical protein
MSTNTISAIVAITLGVAGIAVGVANAAPKNCTFFMVKGDKVSCFSGWKAFWYRNNHDSD